MSEIKVDSSNQSVEVALNSQNNQFFFTRVIQEAIQVAKLNSYIQQLQQKVERAKWKQSLLLQYNYMPLNSIKEKIQTERANYENKVQQFHNKSQKQFQNSDLLQQLQNFRIFSQKLEQNLLQIQTSISNTKLSNQVLKKSSVQKRERLKKMLKQNMELNKAFAQKIGIENKQDLIKLVRSKSQRNYKNIHNWSLKTQKLTQKKIIDVKDFQKNNQFLFSQCYKLLQQQIKHMRSNEDIQSGIYLQIITKKNNPFSHAGRYSLKSNICNTLHERYGSKNSKYFKKSDNSNQFQMDWQGFKQLNWKQILGIMIIKGTKYEKIKQLIKFQ